MGTNNLQPPTAQAYNRIARTYAISRDAFDISEILTRFRQGLPATGAMCDLGCGAGMPVSATFAKDGWTVTGVDASSGMLTLATQNVPAIDAICADMREVRFEPASFDAVTAVYSLFHIPWIEHPRLFATIRTWLVPAGRFLFTYATRDYTGHDEFTGSITFMDEELPYSHTTPEVLRRQLTDAGLEIESFDRHTIGGETFLWVTAQNP